jgi:uncharacterized membrane protein
MRNNIQFKFLFIVVLIIGIFFRFVHLDRKVYWSDETWTSLHVSGYTEEDLKSKTLNGQEIKLEELQQYQRTNPEKTAVDLVINMANQDPQHPPLYYLLTRLWTQRFGNSVAATRSLSALISLLAFPCIYLLCLELFQLPLTGLVAVSLIAVSPVHLLYAQEARQYSLWTVTILLSSWTLLRAIRLKTKGSWILYAITLSISFYTFVFSILVALGHGIYLLSIEDFKLSKKIIYYLVSNFIAVLCFSPWLFMIKNIKNTGWTTLEVPIRDLSKTWILNISRAFIDINYNFVERNYFFYIVFASLLVLVIYSIDFLYRKTIKPVWLFIFTMMGVTAITLIIPDLIIGGRRSSVVRYFIHCYLGIQLTVAYLITMKITAYSLNSWKKKLWKTATVLLISGGVVSCAISSQAERWWNKYNSFYIPNVAEIVNQATNPLIIVYGAPPLDLSYFLNSKVRLQAGVRQSLVMPDGNKIRNILVSPISEGKDVFVLSHNHTSEILDAVLEQNPTYHVKNTYNWKRKIEPVYETKIYLWQLDKHQKMRN